MKKYLSTLTCIAFTVMLGAADVFADTVWDLPLEVNDRNTKVTFEVDTTWHVVYGNIKNASGRLDLVDPADPLSVRSEFRFPVASFDTGWSARDESLHEHMKSEKFPEVIFKTEAVKGDCTPDKVAQGPCRIKLVGTLTVCDVTKEIEVAASIEKASTGYTVSGEYEFKWAEYNVDDPSMVVAKVQPLVKVKYSVMLPEKAK